MKPTDSLRRDHLLIKKMINSLKIVSSLLKDGKSIPESILKQAIDFSTNFTNTCHHGKEEGSLFPALEKNGMPKEGGPIARMLFEHEVTNNLSQAIIRSAEIYLQKNESMELITDIDKYIEHVTMHLDKENQKLFVMADMILSDHANELEHELESVEQYKLNESGQSRLYYENIVNDMIDYTK